MSSLRMQRRGRGIAWTVVAIAAAGTLAACNDFLNSTKFRNNPNTPRTSGPDNLFISIQMNTTARMTDIIAQSICIWMQQCSGQASPYLSIGEYSVGNDSYYGSWADFYGGGGLLDLHTLETGALKRGDSVYVGQAYVLEALLVGTLADVWGDIPYSQADDEAKYPHPKLDPQQVVYDSILTKLQSAIVLLKATGPTNFGALSNDPVFGGDPTKWAALASTLRARYFLHMAKKLGTPMYDSALAAAALGIADNTGAGDYVSANLPTVTQANLWYQVSTVYATFVVSGAAFVDTLKARADPRLARYFDPIDTMHTFVGAAPGQTGGTYSQLDTLVRLKQQFKQPIVTFVENELIQAEASLQGSAPNPAAALTHLNNARAAQGLTPLAGPATLAHVMMEKFIALFQNVEVWSDWRRTNIPALAPFSSGTIPRRIAYQTSEVAANPSIPGPGPQRNWNDP